MRKSAMPPPWTSAPAICWPGRSRWPASSSPGFMGRCAACARSPRNRPMDKLANWDPFQEIERPRLERIAAHGVELKPGDHVRLQPLGRADIFDIALEGKLATIVSIEQDFENRIHLAVTIDDDPGQDLGRDGKPGHRFFFGVEEVEPV